MLSSEGDALIPGAGSLRSRCVSLIILRGRLLFAIGGEIRGRCENPRLLAEDATTPLSLEPEEEEEERRQQQSSRNTNPTLPDEYEGEEDGKIFRRSSPLCPPQREPALRLSRLVLGSARVAELMLPNPIDWEFGASQE